MQILIEKLIEYAEKATPYAGMTLASIKELSENVRKLREEIQIMLSEESLSSS